ncbi:hypothetical protein SAICODRAFT_32267 [Saitoella complicata NRRL Y-17804]|uniref:uncharacterized protein n=1 Tax=Saitoella complicata (strain BCRC 22490 / CBS 7301 / JCM 7358 / NBRC 10748 / NRRL Y-17804) TaxID=698492 RepID=UPI000866BED8|nr:uncharacterized protein SAICODRAFT_32267 [Saitoella complicata NRRL Y-17804]ODQ49779.1 hypothetical protein SAICODRAFT_32267 [Saitoella complicata NRRL Y-17804]
MVFLLFALFLAFISFNYILRSSPINAHANSPAMLLTTATSDPELLQELARTDGCKRQDVVRKVRDRRFKLGAVLETNRAPDTWHRNGERAMGVEDQTLPVRFVQGAD